MPTVISHAVVGAGLFLAVGHGRPGARAGAWTAAAVAMLPDLDALFMRWIPYEAAWGHRGMTHSLSFAVVAGLAAAFALRRSVAIPGGTWGLAVLLAAVAATHGLLDALTDGGGGVALLAPFSDARFRLPWRPIPVAPLVYVPYLWWVLLVEAWMLWPSALALATVRRSLRPPVRAASLAALAASAVPWLFPMGLRPA